MNSCKRSNEGRRPKKEGIVPSRKLSLSSITFSFVKAVKDSGIELTNEFPERIRLTNLVHSENFAGRGPETLLAPIWNDVKLRKSPTTSGRLPVKPSFSRLMETIEAYSKVPLTLPQVIPL